METLDSLPGSEKRPVGGVPKLIKFMFPLHLLAIAAVALQPTAPAILLGRFSKTAIIILIGLIMLAPILWIGTPRLSQTISAEKIKLSRLLALVLIIFCVAALFIESFVAWGVTASYVILGWYFAFILITAGLFALQELAGETTPRIAYIGAV